MSAIVTNIFWSGGYVAGGLLYVLYSDGTYDVVRLKHHCESRNSNHTTFKNYVNAKILRIKRYTKEEALKYLHEKDEIFEEV